MKRYVTKLHGSSLGCGSLFSWESCESRVSQVRKVGRWRSLSPGRTSTVDVAAECLPTHVLTNVEKDAWANHVHFRLPKYELFISRVACSHLLFLFTKTHMTHGNLLKRSNISGYRVWWRENHEECCKICSVPMCDVLNVSDGSNVPRMNRINPWVNGRIATHKR